MRTAIGTLAVVALLAASSGAEAQTHPQGAVANEARNAAWLELGFSSADYDVDPVLGDVDVDTTLLMFMFGGMFRVGEFIELGAAFPFTYSNTEVRVSAGPFSGTQESDGFVSGNPFFRGSFLVDHPRARLRAGLGIALPLAYDGSDPDDDEDQDAYLGAGSFGAAFVHGNFDAWLWVPNRWSLVLPFRADGDEGDVVWAGEMAFGFLFDADDDDWVMDDPDETENFFQMAGEVGGRIGDDMVVGGRLSLWWHTSNEDEQDAAEAIDDDYDDVQLALEPFFRLYGEGMFGSVRILFNLDEPNGMFGSDGQGLWGIFFTGGVRAE